MVSTIKERVQAGAMRSYVAQDRIKADAYRSAVIVFISFRLWSVLSRISC